MDTLAYYQAGYSPSGASYAPQYVEEPQLLDALLQQQELALVAQMAHAQRIQELADQLRAAAALAPASAPAPPAPGCGHQARAPCRSRRRSPPKPPGGGLPPLPLDLGPQPAGTGVFLPSYCPPIAEEEEGPGAWATPAASEAGSLGSPCSSVASASTWGGCCGSPAAAAGPLLAPPAQAASPPSAHLLFAGQRGIW